MLMLVDERRDVVGILRLIGYRRRRILLYVLAEGLVLAVGRRRDRHPARGRVPGRHQPFLSVAVRHDAGLRARDAADRVAVGRDRRSAGRRGGHGFVVVAAQASGSGWSTPVAMRLLTRSLGFAARSLRRQPARASVGILGIAAVGALLLDMLLLSRGLVVSFRDLLDSIGFDVRVLAGDLGPIGGPRLQDASDHRESAGRSA